MARFNRSFSDGGQKISGTDADISGDAVITGDLTVNGTTTTISSTTLTVADKVIVVAQGAADSSAADGAGLSVDGADATFLYDHTGTQWETNKPLEVTGAISSTSTITAGTDLTVTGGDIAFGATTSTVTVAATAHDAAGASLSISAGSTTAGTSNNQAGGSLTISGGQGKGSGAGGDIVFKTANAGSSGSVINSLATAVTISDDKSATFEDNVTVKGDIILDDGGSLKEAGGTAAITFDGSGNVTKIGQDSLSSGDVLTYDGAKWVGEAPTTGDITGVTAGDGLSGGGASGAVSLALDLNELSAAVVAVGSDSIAIIDADDNSSKKETVADLVTAIAGTASSTGLSASSGVLSVSDLHPVGVDGANNQILTDDGDGTVSSESKLTFDGTTLLVDSDVTATTNHTTVGAHIDYDATGIVASGQTGNNVGLDVDINSNSPTMVGTVVNTGIDIDLTGGTSGTQTNIGVDVNVTGADTNYAAVFNGGNVGIGTSAPLTPLHVAGAAPYQALQNTDAENGEGECESRILFADHTGTALAQIEGSHSGTADDTKGKLNLFTHTGSSLTAALTIDDTQLSTFSGDVVISGTNPKLTIGDAGTEDTMLLFDGNAQDFHIALDDSADDLVIGVGNAAGTTTAISINEDAQVSVVDAFAANTAGSFGTFSDGDATPSVATGNLWKHHASAQSITMFDDGIAGQVITVISTAAITYDVTGTNLKGGSTDIVTANGDVTQWCFDGTNWYLLQFMDVSADHSVIGGGGGGSPADDADHILHQQVFSR